MPAGGDGNPRRERQTGIPVCRKPADGVSLRPWAPDLSVPVPRNAAGAVAAGGRKR